MTRSNRVRTIAVLAAGAIVASPLLTACGTGRIANTAEMAPAVPGANATVTIREGGDAYPNSTIGVRNVTVDYSRTGGYPAGGTAPLSVYVFNDTPAPMTLVGVEATFTNPTTDATGTAQVILTATPPAKPSTTAPSSSAPVAPSGSASASPGTSTSATASTSPSPVVTTPPPAGASTFAVPIPQSPSQLTALTRAAGQYLQLDKLSAPLIPGSIVHLVFTFKLGNGAIQKVGDDPAQPVNAPFGPPSSPLPRSPIPLPPMQ